MALLDVVSFAAKYGAGGFVAYWLLVFSYRFVLHPLRSYPGPFVAKFTDAYAGYHALGKRLHLITQRDHKKYGSVIRSAPNRLVFSSPKALRDIYDNGRVTKSEVYLITLGFTGTISVWSALDNNVHRSRRKFVGQAITNRAMGQFEPVMASQVDIYFQKIVSATQKSEAVNMSELNKRLGMDIIGLLAFGFPLNTQTEPQNRPLQEALTTGAGWNNAQMQWPRLQSWFIAYPLHLLTYYATKNTLGALIQQMIQSRLSEDKNARVDFYSLVSDSLESNEDNIQLTEFWSEALFFLAAGGDTTAGALSGLFFYLSRYPGVYSKLAEEIRTTFSSGGDIHGGPELSGCKYLRACIDETLRISPPVSGTLWRKLIADDKSSEPFLVDGHVVPAGTHVGVNIYTLHHNEEYFPEPYTYKPERWLETDDDERRRMRDAFAAFSVGSRGCGGKAMAYLELSLVIAKALWYFDFEKAPGEAGEVGAGKVANQDGRHRPSEYQLDDIFVSNHQGPNLVFRTRGTQWEEFMTK